jgi:hypothetical protein
VANVSQCVAGNAASCTAANQHWTGGMCCID